MYAIEITDLKKHFEEVRAVDGVSLQIQEGETFGLLGPNGAGKTTLIRMITTALTPTAGDAKIKGYSIKKEKNEIVKWIGVCPQENIIFDELTAEENVIFVAQMHGIPYIQAKKKAIELLQMLGIGGKRRWAKFFSGGMKRRLNLAMSIIHDPQILFLDEPTAGLDPQARRMVWDFIRELKQKRHTIVLMTHDMLEADALSDHIAIIDQGKIIAQGTPQELKEAHGGDNVLEIKVQNSQEIALISTDFKRLAFITGWREIRANTLLVTFRGGMQNYLKILQEMSSKIKDVENMNFRQNTLEDVFLNITGRGLRD